MQDKNGNDIDIGDEVVLKGTIIRSTTDKVAAGEGKTATTETVVIEAAGTDGQKRQWAFETQFVESA